MKIVGLQRPHYEDHEITIAQFLLFNESNKECIMRNKDDLQKLWNHRYAIMNTTIVLCSIGSSRASSGVTLSHT